jgi:hypothetical protein
MNGLIVKIIDSVKFGLDGVLFFIVAVWFLIIRRNMR